MARLNDIRFFYSTMHTPGDKYKCDNENVLRLLKSLESKGIYIIAIDLAPEADPFRWYLEASTGPRKSPRAIGAGVGGPWLGWGASEYRSIFGKDMGVDYKECFGKTIPALCCYKNYWDDAPVEVFPRMDKKLGRVYLIEEFLEKYIREVALYDRLKVIQRAAIEEALQAGTMTPQEAKDLGHFEVYPELAKYAPTAPRDRADQINQELGNTSDEIQSDVQQEKTVVVFRKISDGRIIALLPEISYEKYKYELCVGYEYIDEYTLIEYISFLQNMDHAGLLDEQEKSELSDLNNLCEMKLKRHELALQNIIPEKLNDEPEDKIFITNSVQNNQKEVSKKDFIKIAFQGFIIVVIGLIGLLFALIIVPGPIIIISILSGIIAGVVGLFHFVGKWFSSQK